MNFSLCGPQHGDRLTRTCDPDALRSPRKMSAMKTLLRFAMLLRNSGLVASVFRRGVSGSLRRPRPLGRRRGWDAAFQQLEPRLALATHAGVEESRAVALATGPRVVDVMARRGTYTENEVVRISVKFASPVTVEGSPSLPIWIGSVERDASLSAPPAGGTTRVLNFTLPVQRGDLAPAGLRVGSIELPAGAAIRDRAGNDASVAISHVLPRTRVDAVGPRITAMSPPVVTPKSASMRVTFNEPVQFARRGKGAPTMPITVGGTERRMTVDRAASRGSTILFRYRAARGERLDPAAVVVPNSAVEIQSRLGLRDRAGNAASSLGRPTDIALSATGIAENAPGGAAIGTLTTTDVDAGDTFTYTLVSGTGDTDNASFTIDGGTLQTTASFNFETKSSYSVRIRSADQGGLSTEKQFTIAVTNVNEAPTVTSAAVVSVAENQTAVQTVTGSDPDAGTTLTYSISGGADAARFSINSTTGVLTFLAAPDFETPNDDGANNVYDLTVQVSDGTLSVTQAVAVSVTDVAETPPMQFVTVSDPGNQADTRPGQNGYGDVAAAFKIGTYEVTTQQYTDFLNAVADTDAYGLYNTSMATSPNSGQISRSGASGSYTYSVIGSGNRPVTYVSWFDAARFANWMHNGRPTGAQDASTTEDGAYTLNGLTSGNAPARNSGALYYIPTEDQWYKAAYYKGGSANAGYWNYATQSDTAPGTATGSGSNQANYNNVNPGPIDVGLYTGSASFYSTYDQVGNVWEWNDLDGATSGSSRGLRGGSWYDDAFNVSASSRYANAPANVHGPIGFRLASPA